jgi:hypothetical protein
MEHNDSSRGSWVGAPGERGRMPSHRHRLSPDAISLSRYGHAQLVAYWGVPTLLQEALEELATVKVLVSSLEEEAVLTFVSMT